MNVYPIEPQILLQLAANPGNAYVTSTYALVVLDGVLYVVTGEFDNMSEEKFNKYLVDHLA